MLLNKNLLSLSMVAMFATSAAYADDTATTTDTTTTTKKESVTKKMEHAPGAALKETESGVKAVGRGTKKVFTGTEHEMGKLTHMGKKKAKTTTTTDSAGSTTSTTTAQ